MVTFLRLMNAVDVPRAALNSPSWFRAAIDTDKASCMESGGKEKKILLHPRKCYILEPLEDGNHNGACSGAGHVPWGLENVAGTMDRDFRARWELLGADPWGRSV